LKALAHNKLIVQTFKTVVEITLAKKPKPNYRLDLQARRLEQ